MGSEVMRWADRAMFHAEGHDSSPERGVLPRVTLLSATPDPLGTIAAQAMMYEGKVVRSLRDISDDERRHYFEEVQRTHLQTPLETVQFQFLFEGVDRSITHQVVRKRVGLSVAQESLRFAVPGSLIDATSLPPSLQGTGGDYGYDPLLGGFAVQATPEEKAAEERRRKWDDALIEIDHAYHALIDAGMPAEEARGLLPHATATRMQAVYSLRALADEAGNRLCTQAQFHWKLLMGGILQAIREYRPSDFMTGIGPPNDWSWQYQTIASSALFRPVCYKLGRCPFNADFDRACKIRSRVERFAEEGVPSSEWEGEPDQPYSVVMGAREPLRKIDRTEWLFDPYAAVERP